MLLLVRGRRVVKVQGRVESAMYPKTFGDYCATPDSPCPKKMVQERQFALARLSAIAIALNCFELYVEPKIFVSETESILLLKHVKVSFWRN